MKRSVLQIKRLGKELFCGLTLAALWTGCSNVPAKEIPASIPEKTVKPEGAPSGGEFNVKAELDRTKMLSSGKQSVKSAVKEYQVELSF